MTSAVRIRDYRVLFDRQADGWETIGGSIVADGDAWVGVFGSHPYEDDEAGQHPFVVRSVDEGRTWTEPEWLATPGMTADKLAAFYGDPVKTANDRASAARAFQVRAAAVGAGPIWEARRRVRFAAQAAVGLVRQRRAVADGGGGLAPHQPAVPPRT